jgi:hypothetical protein
MPNERKDTFPTSWQRRTRLHQQGNLFVDFSNLCAEGFRGSTEQLALDEKSLKLGVHLLFGCVMRVMSVSVKFSIGIA